MDTKILLAFIPLIGWALGAVIAITAVIILSLII
jgi:uncharacterized membrane protein